MWNLGGEKVNEIKVIYQGYEGGKGKVGEGIKDDHRGSDVITLCLMHP